MCFTGKKSRFMGPPSWYEDVSSSTAELRQQERCFGTCAKIDGIGRKHLRGSVATQISIEMERTQSSSFLFASGTEKCWIFNPMYFLKPSQNTLKMRLTLHSNTSLAPLPATLDVPKRLPCSRHCVGPKWWGFVHSPPRAVQGEAIAAAVLPWKKKHQYPVQWSFLMVKYYVEPQ